MVDDWLSGMVSVSKSLMAHANLCLNEQNDRR